MSNRNIREIVARWLAANGYDGLYNKPYGCHCAPQKDGLMFCDSPDVNCVAGYYVECGYMNPPIPSHYEPDDDSDWFICEHQPTNPPICAGEDHSRMRTVCSVCNELWILSRYE